MKRGEGGKGGAGRECAKKQPWGGLAATTHSPLSFLLSHPLAHAENDCLLRNDI